MRIYMPDIEILLFVIITDVTIYPKIALGSENTLGYSWAVTQLGVSK